MSDSATTAAVVLSTEEKNLSSKELKALKKAEKAQKRAAQKEASGLPPITDPREQKQKQQHQQQGSGDQKTGFGLASIDRRVKLFAHLDAANGTPTVWEDSAATKGVHPAILTLGLEFASYKVVGSTARCRAMMEAFKKLIQDYKTPEGTTISRSLTATLGHQIDFLKTARPLSISMGNSIRYLKQAISTVSIDLTEDQAKDLLLEVIDNFIRERLEVADQVIVKSAVQNINDGDTILTYGHSGVVRDTLIEAHRNGKKFRVVAVDSRPLFEGKKLVRELAENNLDCTYVLISALSYVMDNVTSVVIGAHAMLSNGLLYSRVGTAMVCTSAKSRSIPVTVLCESIKFSDKVQLDAVTFNELAPEKALLNISNDPDNNPIKSPLCENDQSLPSHLSLLNVMYDLTNQNCIKKIITELGSIPASSVPVIIREYKNY